jgi:hypothetical protein
MRYVQGKQNKENALKQFRTVLEILPTSERIFF